MIGIDYGAITLTIGTKNKSSKLRMKTESSKKSEEEIICIKTNRRVSEHEKIWRFEFLSVPDEYHERVKYKIRVKVLDILGIGMRKIIEIII